MNIKIKWNREYFMYAADVQYGIFDRLVTSHHEIVNVCAKK